MSYRGSLGSLRPRWGRASRTRVRLGSALGEVHRALVPTRGYGIDVPKHRSLGARLVCLALLADLARDLGQTLLRLVEVALLTFLFRLVLMLVNIGDGLVLDLRLGLRQRLVSVLVGLWSAIVLALIRDIVAPERVTH